MKLGIIQTVARNSWMGDQPVAGQLPIKGNRDREETQTSIKMVQLFEQSETFLALARRL